MANLTIITVGTLKEDYLKDAIGEYKKDSRNMQESMKSILRKKRSQTRTIPPRYGALLTRRARKF